MIRGIILSRTNMRTADAFCTCVAIRTAGGDWEQVRPLTKSGRHLTYGGTKFKRDDVLRYWQPGGFVDFPDELDRSHARATHPEDVRLDPMRIVLYNNGLDPGKLAQLIKRLTFDSLQELFPTVSVPGSGKPYVAEGALVRSVGYVRGARVQVMEDRAHVDHASGCFNAKITGTDVLGRVVAGQQFPATLRLSLAGPWSGNDIQFDSPRCYVQVSDIVPV